jgi:hypothetical protein
LAAILATGRPNPDLNCRDWICWDFVVAHGSLGWFFMVRVFIFGLIESQIWENVIPTVVTICIWWFLMEASGV